MSMGSVYEFKRKTGLEPYEATDASVLELIYYCAKTMAVEEGRKLPFSVDDFPYLLTIAEGAAAIEAYNSAVLAAYSPKKKEMETEPTEEPTSPQA